MNSDRFDIVAKANTGTDGVVPRREAQQMVQALLADRFKLALHRVTKETDVLALVSGNDGLKLHRSEDGEEQSAGPGEFGQINYRKQPIDALVATQSGLLHTPVVDRTGLHGFFDFTIDPIRYAALTPGVNESYADMVVTAVREQLGLKLEKQKASLEIIVIDHAERPTEN
jgi:uncharacterized protein (TIGR03435 family)